MDVKDGINRVFAVQVRHVKDLLRRSAMQGPTANCPLRTLSLSQSTTCLVPFCVERFTFHDLAFHEAVGSAANSEVLFQMLRTLRNVLRLWIAKVWETRQDKERSYYQHAPILDAIRDHNVQAAREATTRVMDDADEWPERIVGENLQNGDDQSILAAMRLPGPDSSS